MRKLRPHEIRHSRDNLPSDLLGSEVIYHRAFLGISWLIILALFLFAGELK